MIFYFTTIFVLMMFSIGKLRNVKQKVVLRLAMIILCFFATVRSLEIGNDTQTYYNLFMNICRNHNLNLLSSRYEIGYLWLNELFSHLTNNFWVFLSIINIIIYYAYYKFIDTYSINPIMSVFLFFVLGTWGQTMNIIRLQLALAMIIYAFLFKGRGNKCLCAICTVLAVMCQRISLVYVIGLFVPKKVTRKEYIIVATGAMVVYVCLPSFMSLVTNYIPYYRTYLTSSTYKLDEIQFASIIGVFMRLIVFLFSLYVYNRQSLKMYDYEAKAFSLQMYKVFIAMLIMILSLRFNLLDRCGYFFCLFEIVLLPNAIKHMQMKNNRFIVMGIVLGICVLQFAIINIYRPNWNHIYPYKTILFGD